MQSGEQVTTQRPGVRAFALLAGAALALGAGACGSSSHSSAAKVGDCIDTHHSVVDCGSSSATMRLVSDQNAANAIACVKIGASPQVEVKVGEGTFCAESSAGSGSASTGASSAGSSSTPSGQTSTTASAAKLAAFKRGFVPVVNGFRDASQSIGQALSAASHQTDAELASTVRSLATRWEGQVAQLRRLSPPPSLSLPYSKLMALTIRADLDLRQLASAADAHSKGGATKAVNSLVSDIAGARQAATTITDALGVP